MTMREPAAPFQVVLYAHTEVSFEVPVSDQADSHMSDLSLQFSNRVTTEENFLLGGRILFQSVRNG